MVSQSCAFDLAGRPPHREGMIARTDLMVADQFEQNWKVRLKEI